MEDIVESSGHAEQTRETVWINQELDHERHTAQSETEDDDEEKNSIAIPRTIFPSSNKNIHSLIRI
uniref:Uncharacterized protein n=1 Tax=Arion vulgaris TaxID=1028688 RepID=A0A0B7BFV0_9EUPU